MPDGLFEIFLIFFKCHSLGQSTRCEKQRDEAIRTSDKPLVGLYIPQCNRDGEYDQIQCHGSTGYCWCVDKGGREFEETRIKGRPDCSVIVRK